MCSEYHFHLRWRQLQIEMANCYENSQTYDQKLYLGQRNPTPTLSLLTPMKIGGRNQGGGKRTSHALLHPNILSSNLWFSSGIK
jgi:hypothetical protein